MPHDAMAGVFGALALLALLAMALGLRAFWRDIQTPAGPSMSGPVVWPALWRAMGNAASLRYLDGGVLALRMTPNRIYVGPIIISRFTALLCVLRPPRLRRSIFTDSGARRPMPYGIYPWCSALWAALGCWSAHRGFILPGKREIRLCGTRAGSAWIMRFLACCS